MQILNERDKILKGVQIKKLAPRPGLEPGT